MLLHVVNFSISLSLSSSALKNVFIDLIFLLCSVFLRFAPLPLLHIFVLTCFPIFLHFFDLVPSCPLLSVIHMCIFFIVLRLIQILLYSFPIFFLYLFTISFMWCICVTYYYIILYCDFYMSLIIFYYFCYLFCEFFLHYYCYSCFPC